MKPSELRIGNYVTTEEQKGCEAKVLGYDETSIYLDHYSFGENDYVPEAVEPIPLTEEWLLRFGFEVSQITVNGGQVIYKSPVGGGVVIKNWQNESEGLIWGNSDLNGGYIHIAAFKFVHQLQNLYFALTGEELTINES
ncbi:MAG: Phi19:3 [Sphingobacteriaceae bacterium]|jgi:hypothetical protein|nr:Phi19:3 [Sphingobacteriaceae bacterium]